MCRVSARLQTNMNKWITSQSLVKMTVIVLMDGIMGKVAWRNEDGSLQLREMSTIKQFLNPSNNRTIMRKTIAERLYDTTEYYLNNTSQTDACKKLIIFLYAVSGVDLSLWYYDDKENPNERNKTVLMKIVHTIYHTFCGKDQLERSTIHNLIYEQVFGSNWHIAPDAIKISKAHYYNIVDGYRLAYMGRDQLLLSLSEEEMIQKYGNYYNFKDSDNSDMTFEEFQMAQYKQANRLIKNMYKWIHVVKDLLEAKHMEEFTRLYPELHIEQLITEKTIDDQNPHWKEQIFMTNFRMFETTNEMKNLFIALVFSNIHIINHGLFSDNLYQLTENEKDYQNDSNENKYLIESCNYKSFMQYMKDYTNFVLLEVRFRLEKGTFGCFHSQYQFMTHHTTDIREFIKIMVEYLFYGKSNIVGTKTEENNGKLEYKIYHRDTIYKYLTNQQEKFTNKVSDALYYRILYFLNPEMQIGKLYANLTPSEFIEQLWQFFYYVFRVDFYMLRNEEYISSWEEMIAKLFSVAVQTQSIQTLQRMTEQFYIRFQIEIEDHLPSRFTPEEIDYIQEQNTITLNDYSILRRNLLEHLPYQNDASDLVRKIVAEWAKEKFHYLRNAMKSNIDYLFKLIDAQKVEDLKLPDEVTIQVREYLPSNWKHVLYTNRIDIINEAAEETVILTKVDLERYSYYLRLLLYINDNSETNQLNIDELKEELMNYMVKFSKAYTNIYHIFEATNDQYANKNHKKQKDESIDMDLLDSDSIMGLQRTIRNTYKFLLYREWLDNELHLT